MAITEKQRRYIEHLLKAAGFDSAEAAIEAAAIAGRSKHPNNAAAKIFRFYDAGKVRLADFDVSDGIFLIRVLRHPETYLQRE